MSRPGCAGHSASSRAGGERRPAGVPDDGVDLVTAVKRLGDELPTDAAGRVLPLGEEMTTDRHSENSHFTRSGTKRYEERRSDGRPSLVLAPNGCVPARKQKRRARAPGMGC